jgi:hypothetical protein
MWHHSGDQYGRDDISTSSCAPYNSHLSYLAICSPPIAPRWSTLALALAVGSQLKAHSSHAR